MDVSGHEGTVGGSLTDYNSERKLDWKSQLNQQLLGTVYFSSYK